MKLSKLNLLLLTATVALSTAASAKLTKPLAPTVSPNNLPDGVVLAAKQELTRNLGSFPETIDPSRIGDSQSSAAARPLFSPLVRQKPNGEYVPEAAVSWEWGDDKLSLTFHLRKEATWQDGKPVTADDWVYSLRRLTDPKTASSYSNYLALANVVNAQEVSDGKLPPEQLGVEKVDEYSFKINLKQATPWLVQMMSYSAVQPVRQDLVEKYGDAWTRPENFVGNGPYKLVKYAVNDEIVYEKWDGYWDAKNVHITKSNYVFVNDPNTSYYKYLAGEFYSTGIPNNLKTKILAEHPDEVIKAGGHGSSYLDFNRQFAPFQNQDVREAIKLLINNKFVVDKILSAGHASSIWGPTYTQDLQLTTEAPYFSEDMKTRVERANKLLAKAGYTPAKPLEIEYLYPTSKVGKNIAVAFSKQLEEGSKKALKIKTVNTEWKTYLDVIAQGNYQIRTAGWGADYDQASTYYNLWLCGNTTNYAKFCDKNYDDIVLQANATTDATERAKLYAKANTYLQEHSVLVPLWHSEVYSLQSPHLAGLNANNQDVFLRDLFLVDEKK